VHEFVKTSLRVHPGA